MLFIRIIKSFDGVEWKPAFDGANNHDGMNSSSYNIGMMVLNQTSYFMNDPSRVACQELWKDKIFLY